MNPILKIPVYQHLSSSLLIMNNLFFLKVFKKNIIKGLEYVPLNYLRAPGFIEGNTHTHVHTHTQNDTVIHEHEVNTLGC